MVLAYWSRSSSVAFVFARPLFPRLITDAIINSASPANELILSLLPKKFFEKLSDLSRIKYQNNFLVLFYYYLKQRCMKELKNKPRIKLL